MGTTSSPKGAKSPKSPASDPAPDAGAAIEPSAPGEEIDDGDLEASEFDASSTASTSITSSVFQHSYENGRRYHQYRNGRYPIPNDDAEQNRDDMKHALTLELTDGKLFFVPLDAPQKIIDLGTGTGIWAMDMADLFPGAEVHGLDLSPIQSSWVPPNLKFIVDDIEDEWLSGDDFDFVHMRHMCPILKDVATLVGRALEHTKPGGWIELQELGGYVLSDDDTLGESLPAFFQATCDALTKFGMNFRAGNDAGKFLEAAGWTNVSCKTIKAPIGTWPKDKTLQLCGMYMQMALSDLIGAMAAKPLLLLGWDKTQVEVFAAKARADLKNPALHCYLNYRFWTAQKATTA